MFGALRRHCRGEVLDVGGWDFFFAARSHGAAFVRWTTLERDPEKQFDPGDPRFSFVCGDGNSMPFPDASFDTVLLVHVLEHVFDPLRVLGEAARVLRPGGRAVVLVPQTSVLHDAPAHYYNFTEFWVRESLLRTGFALEEIELLGGFWSTIASRLVHLPLKVARGRGFSSELARRNPFFYLMLAPMAAWAAASLPAALVLGLGDLREEANNILAVARLPVKAHGRARRVASRGATSARGGRTPRRAWSRPSTDHPTCSGRRAAPVVGRG
ncbi:MAG: class I SAM-dependent methyltransferase [Deltaproteobacteria bacterium]|nr:class I SAM-dependent methyltransferase [Deltaproteobacteria bacterium]